MVVVAVVIAVFAFAFLLEIFLSLTLFQKLACFRLFCLILFHGANDLCFAPQF
jgi:hypothetical protein